MNKHSYSYPLAASLLLHIVMLVAILFSIHFSTPQTSLGNTSQLVLNSYLFNDNAAQTQSISRSQYQRAVMKSDMAFSRRQHNATVNSSEKLRSADSQVKHSQANHGEQSEALVALLHAAIQNQQHYPVSAIQMEREGRITVAFTLRPDGTIQHLRIIQSSHTNSLDEAAMAAVRDAAPFQQIDKYLKVAQEYNIDVVFQLT